MHEIKDLYIYIENIQIPKKINADDTNIWSNSGFEPKTSTQQSPKPPLRHRDSQEAGNVERFSKGFNKKKDDESEKSNFVYRNYSYHRIILHSSKRYP